MDENKDNTIATRQKYAKVMSYLLMFAIVELMVEFTLIFLYAFSASELHVFAGLPLSQACSLLKQASPFGGILGIGAIWAVYFIAKARGLANRDLKLACIMITLATVIVTVIIALVP